MSTPMKQALIEAAWLLQVFIAALEAIQWNYWGNGLFFLPSIFSLPIALPIMYIVFLQLRLGCGTTSKKQDLLFEAVKSVIVTGLWIWFLVVAVVVFKSRNREWGFLVHWAVGFVVQALVFWPTLVVAILAWRRGRTGAVSLP